MRISITEVRLFKSCRRAWWLRYHEGLMPVATAEPLLTGRSYHAKLEDLYNTDSIDASDLSKESAMATAYQKYIYPNFAISMAEKPFEYSLIGCPGDVKLVGRVDGMSWDGIVEHKTTSAEITDEYEFNLQWDEQLLAYMLGTGKRKAWYTVCRKPTIRQHKDETDSEFFERMTSWYDTDTESKIRLLQVTRTDKEIAEFERDLTIIAHEMQDPWIYRNPAFCTQYGRRCDYAPVCLTYAPDMEYVQFNRRNAQSESRIWNVQNTA